MNRTTLTVTTLASFGFCVSAMAQSAGSWYPSGSAVHLYPKNAWYDTRTFGTQSRVGFQFTNTTVNYFFYFSPADPAQVAKANSVYATLLAAIVTGQEVSVFISGSDTYLSGAFDFLSIQIGPNF